MTARFERIPGAVSPGRAAGRTVAGFAGVLAGGVLLALLSGCATLDAMKKPAPAPAVPTPAKPAARPASAAVAPERAEPPAPDVAAAANPAQQALSAGIDLYNNGDFNAAIRKLNAPDIANADKPTQLSALKYSAFSYCVTKRQTTCRQQFAKAFKLDPAFDLAPGEKGHPLWTRAFEAAKLGSKPKK